MATKSKEQLFKDYTARASGVTTGRKYKLHHGQTISQRMPEVFKVHSCFKMSALTKKKK